MDPRWQPHLPHWPAATAATAETRQLFADGWRPQAGEEGWLRSADGDTRMLVAPPVWRGLCELLANVPVRLAPQRI